MIDAFVALTLTPGLTAGACAALNLSRASVYRQAGIWDAIGRASPPAGRLRRSRAAPFVAPNVKPCRAALRPLVVVCKRPTLTCYHLTPPDSPSLLQVSINSEEVHPCCRKDIYHQTDFTPRTEVRAGEGSGHRTAPG